MSRQVPAVDKNFPAAKALALDFALLPVVNAKKQVLGIVLRSELIKLLGGPLPSTEKNMEVLPSQTDSSDIPELRLAQERAILLRKAGLIAYAPKMLRLVDLCLRVAPADSTVLITGESGVGKELFANLIHAQSNRALGPLVKINCGAIPENLLESELFGYEAGAFTGANRQGKLGMFELAHGGTLLLDEVGELPLHLQVKLLRAIQTQEIVRVGGVKTKKVDIRVVAATNRDLAQMVSTGAFRQDLYFRLNVVPLEVPPLRERREDILPLLHHMQIKFTHKLKMEKRFAPEVLKALHNYTWPGNVRELENIVEQLFVLTPGYEVTAADLPPKLCRERGGSVKVSGIMPLRQAVQAVEEQLLTEALSVCGGTYQAAAALGIDQSTFVRKLTKFKR